MMKSFILESATSLFVNKNHTSAHQSCPLVTEGTAAIDNLQNIVDDNECHYQYQATVTKNLSASPSHQCDTPRAMELGSGGTILLGRLRRPSLQSSDESFTAFTGDSSNSDEDVVVLHDLLDRQSDGYSSDAALAACYLHLPPPPPASDCMQVVVWPISVATSHPLLYLLYSCIECWLHNKCMTC